ncbi:unnamed protein product [Absidia cylindrospora]
MISFPDRWARTGLFSFFFSFPYFINFLFEMRFNTHLPRKYIIFIGVDEHFSRFTETTSIYTAERSYIVDRETVQDEWKCVQSEQIDVTPPTPSPPQVSSTRYYLNDSRLR